jgi:hypothetical protein
VPANNFDTNSPAKCVKAVALALGKHDETGAKAHGHGNKSHFLSKTDGFNALFFFFNLSPVLVASSSNIVIDTVLCAVWGGIFRVAYDKTTSSSIIPAPSARGSFVSGGPASRICSIHLDGAIRRTVLNPSSRFGGLSWIFLLPGT